MLNRQQPNPTRATRYVVLRDEPGYPTDPQAQRLTLVCDNRFDEDGNPVDVAWYNGELAVEDECYTLAMYTSRQQAKQAVVKLLDVYDYGTVAGVITVIEVEVETPFPVESIPDHDLMRLADIFSDRESDPKYL